MSCAIDRQQVLDSAALGEGKVTRPLTAPAYQIPTATVLLHQRPRQSQAVDGRWGYERRLHPQYDRRHRRAADRAVRGAEHSGAVGRHQHHRQHRAAGTERLRNRWLAGDFDLAVALNGGRPDPYTMYVRYFTKDGNLQKVSNFPDYTLDSLMQQGRVETDPAKGLATSPSSRSRSPSTCPGFGCIRAIDYTAQQKYVAASCPIPPTC